MSAFRGARILMSFGPRSLRCNHLNQRKIVSLGLTSLCQVNMKRRALLDAYSLPVNKFDLASVGISSPTLSTLFSTEAISLADNDSDELVEGEGDSGILVKQISKWPAPVGRRSNKRKRNLSKQVGTRPAHDDHKKEAKMQSFTDVHIDGIGFDFDESYLKELFSQFGEVLSIKISRRLVHKENIFGFVCFAESSSASKAIDAKMVIGKDGTNIRINEFRFTHRNPYLTNGIKIKHLPEDISVSQINDYFQQFGDIQVINLKLPCFNTKEYLLKEIFANLRYKQLFSPIRISSADHYIGGTRVHVSGCIKDFKTPLSRCQTLYISELEKDITDEEIRAHFGEYGVIEKIVRCTDDRFGMVKFLDRKSAVSAADACWHAVGNSNIKAQLLSILND